MAASGEGERSKRLSRRLMKQGGLVGLPRDETGREGEPMSWFLSKRKFDGDVSRL